MCKITGMLKSENVKLKLNYIWDVTEIVWKEVNVTLNHNKINLSKSVTIRFRDKFKIRHMIEREPLLFHIMLRQGFNWFILASNCINQHRYTYRQWPVKSNPGAFLFGYFG